MRGARVAEDETFEELGDIFTVPLRPHNRSGRLQELARALAGTPGEHAWPGGAARRRGAGNELGRAVRVAPDGRKRLAAAP